MNFIEEQCAWNNKEENKSIETLCFEQFEITFIMTNHVEVWKMQRNCSPNNKFNRAVNLFSVNPTASWRQG